MSSCPDLVTKEDFNKLKLLVDQKLDKDAEKTIIDKASVLAVPLAVAATSKKLVPRITSAAEKATQAFTTASTNTGKILGNAGKIAANAANIFGLVADVVALAIVFKHETVDLPQIRSQISTQQSEINTNFQLILDNKKKLGQQERKLAQQATRISENNRQLTINTGIILRNEDDIFANKSRISENQRLLQQNRLELQQFKTKTEREIKEVRDVITAELAASEARIQAKLEAQEREINQKIANVQNQIDLKNAVLQGLIIGLQNTFANFRSNTATKPEVNNLDQELNTVKNTSNTALSTARQAINFWSSSGNTAQIEADIQKYTQGQEEKNQELEEKIVQLENNGTVNEQQIQDLRNGIKADNQALLAGLGIAGLPLLINQIRQNQLTQNQVKSATNQAICESSSGGCLTNNVVNPIRQGQNTLSNLVQSGLQGVDLVQGQTILNVVNDTNNFLKKAWQTTRMDKVLNLLNTVLALHNALMLSRNLGQTLGDVVTQALQFLNIKDAEDNSIDVNEVIGSTVNTWITNLIGDETYTNIQQTWTSLNRIMVAAQGVVFAVQGIKFAVLEAIETVGSWTAKIGNNMMIQGLFEEKSFPWMDENVNFRNPFGNFIERINTTEEVIGQVNNLVSSGIEAQENFNELFDQVGEAGEATGELKTSSEKLAESLTIADTDKEAIEQQENLSSASPEITNQDLIKSEIENN